MLRARHIALRTQKGSAACTIIKIVFMIDIHIHAYDYLLSHWLELVA